MSEFVETSQFNEAVMKLTRINLIWQDLYSCKRNKNYNGQIDALNGIYTELVAWLKKTEKDDERGACNKMRKICTNLIMFHSNNQRINVLELEEWLLRYETLLREAMRRYKLDMPGALDPGKSMLG